MKLCSPSQLRATLIRYLTDGTAHCPEVNNVVSNSRAALLQIWRIKDARETRYLFLDEPTANLDIGHELAVLRLAEEVASTRVGVLVVLHDLNLAARFTNELLLLSEGKVGRERSY